MLGIKTKSALIEFSTVIRILGKYSRSIRTIKVPQIPNRYIYFENKSLNVYFLSICYLLLQWTKAWPRPRLISKSFIPMNRPQFLSIFGCFWSKLSVFGDAKMKFSNFRNIFDRDSPLSYCPRWFCNIFVSSQRFVLSLRFQKWPKIAKNPRI